MARSSMRRPRSGGAVPRTPSRADSPRPPATIHRASTSCARSPPPSDTSPCRMHASGNNVLCPRSWPSTKRFIRSPAHRAGILTRESHQTQRFSHKPGSSSTVVHDRRSRQLIPQELPRRSDADDGRVEPKTPSAVDDKAFMIERDFRPRSAQAWGTRLDDHDLLAG